MMVQITTGIFQNLLVNMFGKLIPFHGLNTINNRKFLLVFTNTTNSATKAFIKYDTNFNEVASRTYTQLGSLVNYPARTITSSPSDNLYYYVYSDLSSSTARIFRYNSDLTGVTFSGSLGSTPQPQLLDVGFDAPNFIISNASSLLNRSKTPLFAVTGTASSFSTAAPKYLHRISNDNTIPADFLVTSTSGGSNGVRRYTTNSNLTSYTLTWQTAFGADSAIIDVAANKVVIYDSSGGNTSRVLNLSNGNSAGTLNEFSPSVRFFGRYSNGDVVFWRSSNTRISRRTFDNILNDVTTDVWNITFAQTPVWMGVDDEDNLYVIVAATTNGVRKYNSAGILVLSLNLPANGYGGAVVYK